MLGISNISLRVTKALNNAFDLVSSSNDPETHNKSNSSNTSICLFQILMASFLLLLCQPVIHSYLAPLILIYFVQSSA